jgi:hypothetical protein
MPPNQGKAPDMPPNEGNQRQGSVFFGGRSWCTSISQTRTRTFGRQGLASECIFNKGLETQWLGCALGRQPAEAARCGPRAAALAAPRFSRTHELGRQSWPSTQAETPRLPRLDFSST